MATTTNYGWTTPNDTDLVKDGAAAIRTLGSSIDTTVFANASAGIAKTIVDAKGDLIAATAADTVARLAVGANGTVLTAASGQATGLEWATPSSGGMTLISTTTLSGASVTLSSIPQTFVSLYLVIRGITNTGGNGVNRLAFNGTTNLTNTYGIFNSSGSSRTNSRYELGDGSSSLRTDTNNIFVVTVDNYTSTTNYKTGQSYGSFVATDGTTVYGLNYTIVCRSNSALSSIVIDNDGGNLSAGTALLYGVK